MRYVMKYLLLFLVLISITSTFAQEPIKDLSIGNRWTYNYAGWRHGQGSWDYDYAWQIIGDTIINNYVFSTFTAPFYERADTVLVEKFYYCHQVGEFITEVNYDFSLPVGGTLITTTGTIVMLFKGDSVFFGESQPYIIIRAWGCLYDSWTTHQLLISKKFGLIHLDANGVDQAFDIWLKGALIDGVLYGDTTVVSVSDFDNLPMLFALEQNSPNPFNPSTTIRFTISDLPAGRQGLRFTTLKVYDLLGREVATLVNEEKPAGNYEVEFNATGFPSGIYFYQLRAGNPSSSSGQDYVETKKMVLLR